MGQFEIKGQKVKELTPDVIILTVYASIHKQVEDSYEYIETTKSELKETVAKLTLSLTSTSENCNVSFSNLKYDITPSDDLFASSSKPTFGAKKKQNNVIVNASTQMSIRLTTRDEAVLTSVLKLLIDATNISRVYDTVEVSDLEEEYTKLRVEMCKKCKKDADVIVTSLGSEILGVKKVVYNSDGVLLNNDTEVDFTDTDADSFGDCDAFDTYLDESIEFPKCDGVWIKGFVDSVLGRTYRIYDSITVLFNIK